MGFGDHGIVTALSEELFFQAHMCNLQLVDSALFFLMVSVGNLQDGFLLHMYCLVAYVLSKKMNN